jgi:hypothetical protein
VARWRQRIHTEPPCAEERSADFSAPNRDGVRSIRPQARAPFGLRPGLRQAYRSGGNGVHISAVNAAITIDVPAPIEGSSGIDPARQRERIEDIHTPVPVDVFAGEWAGADRTAEPLREPSRQDQTRRHRRPRQPGFPTRARTLEPP